MPTMQLSDTASLTGKTKELLSELNKSMGLTPNVLKQMANAPAALEAFLLSRDALSKGFLTGKMRALVGIVIAETYSCEYLLSARVAMAKKVGLTDEEIELAKKQTSTNAKDNLGMQFVRNIILRHAEIADTDVGELKAAGYSDGEIVELIANTSNDMFIYYLIQIAQPEADFPRVATVFPPK